MEKLIEKHESDGSLSTIFADAFPINKHPFFPGGWAKQLQAVDSTKKKTKKSLENSEKSEVTDGKLGARLLLLLAYVMVSTVLDDKSNTTQM